MKTIIVDSDEMSREVTLYLAGTIECLRVEHAFHGPEEAISYMKKKKVELAIIDTKMLTMSGIDLGYCLREINPDLILVYTSATGDEAMEALKMRAAAYLLKPLNQDELRYAVESAVLLARRRQRRVYARTFGYFDLFVNGRAVMFKSAKAKELLALLIDRRGGTLTTDQIISVLWEDRPNDESTQNLCSKITKTLQKELDEYGIGDILIQKRGVRSIDAERVDCDMYELMRGNHDSENCFLGDYMIEYSWAEDRLSALWKRANLLGI
ncbi:MAG: response regulator [Lachnospiraceae bacterium]|nr:response regulator [Lachnospiraceae bacterium]